MGDLDVRYRALQYVSTLQHPQRLMISDRHQRIVAHRSRLMSSVLAVRKRNALRDSPREGSTADFILPSHDQVDALAAGLAPDWAATVWLMHGCGLRVGEALAVNLRCRVNGGSTLRVKEQVNPFAQLRPLKHRTAGEFRDIPLLQYVSEAIDKHAADYGTTSDGYLFQGRKYVLVVRRTYQEDFHRAAVRARLQPEFIPHSLRTPPPPWPRAFPSPTSPAGSATRASRSPARSTATSGWLAQQRKPRSVLGAGSSQGAQIRYVCNSRSAGAPSSPRRTCELCANWESGA